MKVFATLRRTALLAIALTVPAAAYIGSPFVAAWNIREAIRAGDTEYLRDRVDWPAVRASLKPSAQRMMLQLPTFETGGSNDLTFWQRLKLSVAGPIIDRAITTYLSPEGLPTLLALSRRAMPARATALADEGKQPIAERLGAFWARVARAEFMSPTLLELEVADKSEARRHFIGTLEMRGSLWTLVSLRITRPGDSAPRSLDAHLADAAGQER